MTRIIRIETCRDCDHKDHKGAFGAVAYIPFCNKTKQELPFTVGLMGTGNRVGASYTGVIPEWCPLEKLNDPN